jgi:hypothetical protein
VINPDGGTAIRVPGMTSSATPSWVTGSSLPEQTDNVAITLSLVATSAVSYALSSGSLPPGLSLNANTGVITGTVTSVTVDTSYTFTITATDAELQDSPRTFTVTIAVSDPYFRYTTLLLSGSALSANTVVRDSSTNNFNLTVFGDSRASNFTPYGTGWSAQFDGTGDYLNLGGQSAFVFGTGDWTIEFWMYSLTNGGTLFDTRPSGTGGTTGYGVIFLSSNTVRYDTAGAVRITGSTSVLNTWAHVALCKASGTTRLFINGIQDGSSYTDSVDYLCGANRPIIASDGNSPGSVMFTGYLSNYRIVKGTALYTANFTPATTNLTAVANTSLLTCHVNSFRDASTNNFTITRNGDVAIRSFNPFNITNTGVNGSMYFDGNGDYLSTSNSAFAVGTGAFTIEAWVYPFTVSGKALVSSLASSVDPAGDRGIACYLDGARIGRSVTAQLDDISTSIVPVAYQWNHIALVRENTSTNGVKFYVNGLLGGQGTSAISVNKQQVVVGRQYPSEDYNYLSGYISSVRWTNAAVYTSAFTPPTSPLTAIANTQLLTLQYDQPHNNHTFLDSSSNQFVITRNGNASQGTFSPFSPTGWSVFFDGSNDFLELSTQAILNVGTGNFTVECFINFTNKAQTWSRATVLGTTEATSSSALLIQVLGATQGAGGIAVNAAGAGITASTPLATNTWHHIAAVRNSGTMILYINGTASGNVASSGSLTTPSYKIGAFKATDAQYDDYYNGYVSNIRTANVAVYTSNFTPPIAPLTLTTGGQNPPQSGQAKFLSCQSNRFLDVGPGAYTVTPTNGPTIQAFSPFAPSAKYAPETHGGSMYFDSSGDYINTGSDVGLNLGTGNFTWEFWTYLTATPSDASILFQPRTPAGIDAVLFGYKSGSNLTIYATTDGGSSWNLFNNTTIIAIDSVLNRWAHWAFVRNGSTYTVYVDGISRTSSTSANQISQATNVFTIGNNVPGYFSSFRFTKAQALTTGNFNPPTAPTSTSAVGWTGANVAASITGTVNFLLNFTDAAILDSTGRNAIETVGDARTSALITKFTGGSMYFDGSDYIQFPVSDNFYFYGSNFTIEGWVYANNVPAGYTYLVSVWGVVGQADTTYSEFVLRYNNSNLEIVLQPNGGASLTAITGTGNGIVANAWQHLAAVRNGNNVSLYINGSSVASATYTQSLNSPASKLVIGAQLSGGAGASYFTGYINDLRITKGYARYTANFTAPTLPHRLK